MNTNYQTARPYTLGDRMLLHGHATMSLRVRMEPTESIPCAISLAERPGKPGEGYILTVYRYDEAAGDFFDERLVMLPQELGEQLAAAFLTPEGEWTEGETNGSH